MKRVLSVLLAVVIFASTFAAFSTVSEAATTYPSITANSIRSVNIKKEDDTMIFKFVPSSTGYYAFTSVSNADTKAYIYDSYWDSVASDDESGYGSNFSIQTYLYAGETYYLEAYFYSSSAKGAFTVVLAKSENCRHQLYTQSLKKATKNANGSLKINCSQCSVQFSKTIYRPTQVNLAASSYAYTGSAIKPKPGVKDAGGYAIAASDFACSYGKNVNAGTGVVKVKFNSMWYDSSCAITKKFKITPKKLKKCGFRTVHTYSGKPIVPTPYYYKTVKEWSDYSQEYYTWKKMTGFKKNVDYTIKVSGGHKQVGTYTAVIKFKGNYRGTIKKTFQIRPKPVTTIKGVAVSTSSVKFVWNKVKNISGYRVDRYNTAKNKWQVYKYTTSNKLTIPRVRAKDGDVWIKVYTYKKIGGKVYYNDGSRTPSKWTYTKPAKTAISLKNTDWGKVSIYFNRSISHQIEWNKSITFDSCGGSGKVYGSDAYVYNLPSDTRYYFRAREYYYDDNGNLFVGPWSNVKSIVTW